jgi:CheY-like chemotaxis protein
LVVEDDESLRSETVLLLEDRGYDVVDCPDAQAALEQLETGAVPDLILLDLFMPVMDGWEFRVQQKRVAEWAAIPVITMSADRTVKAGAIDTQAHLTKPFESALLLAAVDEQLHTAERKHDELRAGRRARLRALGKMAASVAYESENPITFVLTSLELAQQQCKELEARLSGADAFSLIGVRQLLSRSVRGAEHIAWMARRMSVFAEADGDEARAVDVAEVVDASLQLVRNELRDVCRVERELANLATITSHPGKLALVLVNLFLSALESMRGVHDREHVLRVVVSTSVSNNAVMIAIADTGSDVDADALNRAIELYFSHRKGLTRIGTELAVSCELLRELGGLLKVENNAVAGSLVKVILPVRISSGMLKAAPTPLPGQPDQLGPGDQRRARVLLVAEDPMISRLLVSLLGRAYDVIAIAQPDVALLRLLGKEWFDVVLCDLLMPGVSGIALYERTILVRPDLEQRFIFMADETYHESESESLGGGSKPVLKKPFQHDELFDMIEALLSTKH